MPDDATRRSNLTSSTTDDQTGKQSSHQTDDQTSNQSGHQTGSRLLGSLSVTAVLTALVLAIGVGLVAADWPGPQAIQSPVTIQIIDDTVKAPTPESTPVKVPVIDPAARQAAIAEISRRVFIKATLDIGEAFHIGLRKSEPNLNVVTLSNTATDTTRLPDNEQFVPEDTAAATDPAAETATLEPTIPVFPDSEGLLALLVRFPSRRDLSVAEAWRIHHERLLMAELSGARLCSTQGDGNTDSEITCGELVDLLTPSFDTPEHGAYERVPDQRTNGTHISAITYLTAAFELGLWRPVDLHPAAADSFRTVAANTRRRTASTNQQTTNTNQQTTNTRVGCDISALWIAAAVATEFPTFGSINFGVANIASDVANIAQGQYDIPSLGREVARRGCRAAAKLPPIRAPAPATLPFWSQPMTSNLTGLIDPAIHDTLVNWYNHDDERVGKFRACDFVPSTVDRSITQSVNNIKIHPCLFGSLEALIDAAAADRISLWGSGWRSSLRQVTLRISNCNLPPRRAANYHIELSLAPSDICNPPTAPPGRSRHEAGLAVDFSCGRGNDRVLNRSDRCYRWLQGNAHIFGFYNLPGEPWHWSIDGR